MDSEVDIFSMPPDAAGSSSPRVRCERDIFGIKVKAIDREAALDEIRRVIADDGHVKYAFLNAHGANLAWSDKQFRQVLGRFSVLADGVGVDIASKLLYGNPFPSNLNGTDFIPALFQTSDQPLKVALIGARHEVIEAAVDNLADQYPAHFFKAVRDGYFDASERDAILSEVADLNPDILLIAFGNPDQEVWIDTYCGPQHANVVIGVGALFDFLSKRVPRAPKIWRTLRIEWLYRLALEPRRLWRRYLVGNPTFILRVLIQKFGRKSAEN